MSTKSHPRRDIGTLLSQGCLDLELDIDPALDFESKFVGPTDSLLTKSSSFTFTLNA